jgi:DNA-binding SARP family transcriptional activator
VGLNRHARPRSQTKTPSRADAERASFRRDATTDGDLRILGLIAETLSPDDILGSLDRVLGIVRRHLESDDAEVFLVEPVSELLLLVACQGVDKSALLACTLFEPGSGYPGIVTSTRRSIVTRNLSRDRRFLREGVKQRGVRAYVSVPVLGPSGALGSIHLGWRRSDAPVARARALLVRASRPIATAVRAGIAALRDAALVGMERDGAAGLDESALRSILMFMQRLVNARAATLVTSAGVTACFGRQLSAAGAPVSCGTDIDGCPCLAGGRPLFLDTTRDRWPVECTRLPSFVRAARCLPLHTGDGGRGIIVLAHEQRLGRPATRHIVPLMAMARAIATRLRRAPPSARLASETTAPPVLSIRCLGPIEIRRDGVLVPPSSFERKSALTLLRILILAGGAPVHRDLLVERLWPDAPDRGGANRLHGVVHALRAAIEPHFAAHEFRFIRNSGPLYHFDTSSGAQVDLFTFREKVARIRRALRTTRTVGPETVADLEDAIALYGGALFADDPCADWCAIERDALQEQFLCAVQDLAVARVAATELDRAAEAIRMGLRVDPFREDLHCALIENLMRLGRRAEALAQYRECLRLLHDELGAEPLPETRRLGERVHRSIATPERL